MNNDEYFVPEDATQEQFHAEVQQYRELRDLEYEMWAKQLNGEYWWMWYDFVERGEPT